MPLATAGEDQTGTSVPTCHRSLPDESSAWAKCASELPAKTTCSLTAGEVITQEIFEMVGGAVALVSANYDE